MASFCPLSENANNIGYSFSLSFDFFSFGEKQKEKTIVKQFSGTKEQYSGRSRYSGKNNNSLVWTHIPRYLKP